MIKPGKRVIIEALDYHECQAYIADKLGIRNIRDIADRHAGNPTAPYQDWWHQVIEHANPDNASLIEISKAWWRVEALPEWALPIFKAFVEEFGEDASYWVEW